jgi:hypothetical protein
MPGFAYKQIAHCFRHTWELVASSMQDVHRVCMYTFTLRLSDYRWCWQRTYEWTYQRYPKKIGRSTLLKMPSKVCKNDSIFSLAWSHSEWEHMSRVKRSLPESMRATHERPILTSHSIQAWLSQRLYARICMSVFLKGNDSLRLWFMCHAQIQEYSKDCAVIDVSRIPMVLVWWSSSCTISSCWCATVNLSACLLPLDTLNMTHICTMSISGVPPQGQLGARWALGRDHHEELSLW